MIFQTCLCYLSVIVPVQVKYSAAGGPNINILKPVNVIKSHPDVTNYLTSTDAYTKEVLHKVDQYPSVFNKYRSCFLEIFSGLKIDTKCRKTLNRLPRENVKNIKFKNISFLTAMSITSAAASIVAEPNLLFEKFSFFQNSFVSRLHSYIPDICTSLSPTMTCEEGNVYHFGDGAYWDHAGLCSLVQHMAETDHRTILLFASEIPTNFDQYWKSDIYKTSLLKCPHLFSSCEPTVFETGSMFHLYYKNVAICNNNFNIPSNIKFDVHVVGNSVFENLAIMPVQDSISWIEESNVFEKSVFEYISFIINILANIDDDRVGIALPGGGARTAAIACCGLHAIHKAEKIPFVISATSGGAWGSALYYSHLYDCVTEDIPKFIFDWFVDAKNRLNTNNVKDSSVLGVVYEIFRDVSMFGFDWQELVANLMQAKKNNGWSDAYHISNDIQIILNACLLIS